MPRFEVRNPEIEQDLWAIGNVIAGELPPGWGFALFVFDFGPAPGSTFYASNAKRDDMVRMLREFIDRQEHEASEV